MKPRLPAVRCTRDDAVAAGSRVARVHRIPPTHAATDELIEWDLTSVDLDDLQVLEPHAEVQDPRRSVLEEIDGVGTRSGASHIEAETLPPPPELLVSGVNELPAVDEELPELLEYGNPGDACETDDPALRAATHWASSSAGPSPRAPSWVIAMP